MPKKNYIKKIAYLFGAGATHAELLNFKYSQSDNFLDENGLLISNVSKRVMKVAQNDPTFKKDVEHVTSRSGPVNIELLISLFESNPIPDVDVKIRHLKNLVQDDIKKVLTPNRKSHFFLHKALFELHNLTPLIEEPIGYISLNYDNVMDVAYKAIYKKEPNYCLTSAEGSGIPLLKLHGSFNWTKINNYGKQRDISIIPLGINKNYLVPPYNFIWSRAFEVLARCDILRIIGCSLNQNDIGLIDLLFKAHLERRNEFDIEIINKQQTGERIKYDYGFFPSILTPEKLENGLLAYDNLGLDVEVINPFRIWLRRKAENMLKEEIDNTRYLKMCI